MDTNIIMVVVVLLAAVVIGFLIWQKRRREILRQRFGPEYEKAVKTFGSRRRAERELELRSKRVEKLHIHPLPREEQARFHEEWRQTQADFVDEPVHAVERADELVKEVMQARGYPIVDFEQRAADISVDHPKVVDNYRLARDIAQRNRKGQASTEELRHAMIYYRDLFEDLLETRAKTIEVEEKKEVEVGK